MGNYLSNYIDFFQNDCYIEKKIEIPQQSYYKDKKEKYCDRCDLHYPNLFSHCCDCQMSWQFMDKHCCKCQKSFFLSKKDIHECDYGFFYL